MTSKGRIPGGFVTNYLSGVVAAIVIWPTILYLFAFVFTIGFVYGIVAPIFMIMAILFGKKTIREELEGLGIIYQQLMVNYWRSEMRDFILGHATGTILWVYFFMYHNFFLPYGRLD